MITIDFLDNKEPDKPKICALRQAFFRRSFLEWVAEFKPDFLSSRVLSVLIGKYAIGDVDALFEKMKQLERDEHYELCVIFKSMFDKMKINDEYVRWTKNYA